ncbi:MAG TPA: phospholipase D-like domain-containing protein [Puia sp.]
MTAPTGSNPNALFTLKIHRGEGMALLAMNWKNGRPSNDFVGFAIEYKEPNGTKFWALNNRLTFPGQTKSKDTNKYSTLRSPIQKFRWVHFPLNADLPGNFTYRVTPVFMTPTDEISYGEAQTVDIVLASETYPGQLNIAYTRGFVSSQAFVDYYSQDGKISTLLPASAKKGLTFTPTHPRAQQAYAWMGFEAYREILKLLDDAIADTEAKVMVVAYDFNEPDVVDRLVKLGTRVRVIIDNSGDHKKDGSAENQAEQILIASAGASNVKRQHMGSLQHNKTIIVDGPTVKKAIGGSTNLSWRGFFVQNNNAAIVTGATAVQVFTEAFDAYWASDLPADFGTSPGASAWNDLGLEGIDAKVSFSPHADDNERLNEVADDISNNTTSSCFYSLAFLYETPGVILDAIKKITNEKEIFVYGISDKKVGGITVTDPDGNKLPVAPEALGKDDLPEPFREEATGGSGTRMHHKFVVIDFDKPTARVYFGSYNFSVAADTKNGENLFVIRDPRVATSYMIEAVRIFNHYEFRNIQSKADKKKKVLELAKPPVKAGDLAWWDEDYTDAIKIRDRELFS